jgi:hypothetical protein
MSCLGWVKPWQLSATSISWFGVLTGVGPQKVTVRSLKSIIGADFIKVPMLEVE